MTRRVGPPSLASSLGMPFECAATLAEPDALAQLRTALENVAATKPAVDFAGRYLLLQERVEGGQAVVNFARDANGGVSQYAIKCAPLTSACFCKSNVVNILPPRKRFVFARPSTQ